MIDRPESQAHERGNYPFARDGLHAPRDRSRARRSATSREGFWGDESLGELLAAGLHDAAGNPFAVRSDRKPFRGTLGDVDALARRVAAGMRARGIERGDVVAFQLPNWLEAAATFYAIAYLGAVVVPIVHFYGPKEVGYILRKTRVKALVTADRFGHQDFLANLDSLRDDLPDLEWVAVVGDRGGRDLLTFDDLVRGRAARRRPRPSTRARPRSSRTRRARRRTRRVSCTRTARSPPRSTSSAGCRTTAAGRRYIIGAPVGHGIGMLAALLIPVWRRSEIQLIDVWDPGRVLQAMLDDGLSAGQGSTYFLTSLLDHPDFDPERHAEADAVHRARRLGGARRGRRAVRASSASRPRAASDRPNTRRSPAATPTRRTTSASAPTAGRCPASRCGSSTTTATTSRSASRARSGRRAPTGSSATPTRTRPTPRSAPTAGS